METRDRARLGAVSRPRISAPHLVGALLANIGSDGSANVGFAIMAAMRESTAYVATSSGAATREKRTGRRPDSMLLAFSCADANVSSQLRVSAKSGDLLHRLPATLEDVEVVRPERLPWPIERRQDGEPTGFNTITLRSGATKRRVGGID